MRSGGLSVRNLNCCRLSARSASSFTVDNPYTLETVCEIPFVQPDRTQQIMANAERAQKEWGSVTLSDRIALCGRFMVEFEKIRNEEAANISKMMGKPLSQAQNEVNGMYERVTGMMALAPAALADDTLPWKPGNVRFIRKEPVGTVLVIAPWNYPLLTAINAVVPAVLAGNSVVIKPSPRTPLAGDAIARAFAAADAPQHLVSSIHATHEATDSLIQHPSVGHVVFTGSVATGHVVYRAAARERFVDATLELGGKDAAYVAEDADIAMAAAGLADGAFYNAGQSCCGVKRIFVHHKQYAHFVEALQSVVSEYKLGDPMDPETSLGPLALPETAELLLAQAQNAEELGGRVVSGGVKGPDHKGQGRFLQPTVVANAAGFMRVMKEESFGPLVAVQCVQSDEHAVERINDCNFGLTASIFTSDTHRASHIMPQLNVGTVFMNRCDYLDPSLAWSGRNDTGKGCSLSTHGFKGMIRFKSCNFKV